MLLHLLKSIEFNVTATLNNVFNMVLYITSLNLFTHKISCPLLPFLKEFLPQMD